MLPAQVTHLEREFLIDNLLVRIHFIIAMIRWTGSHHGNLNSLGSGRSKVVRGAWLRQRRHMEEDNLAVIRINRIIRINRAWLR